MSYRDHPKEVYTPHIDALASTGVRMTNGYASAYVCAPTRAGLITGRYQQRFGFYTACDSRTGLPTDEVTLADLLKEAGYRTGIFGKWHLGLIPDYHPNNRGFDEFYGFLGHGAAAAAASGANGSEPSFFLFCDAPPSALASAWSPACAGPPSDLASAWSRALHKVRSTFLHEGQFDTWRS